MYLLFPFFKVVDLLFCRPLKHFNWTCDVDMDAKLLKCSIELHFEKTYESPPNFVILDCVDLRVLSISCSEGTSPHHRETLLSGRVCLDFTQGH